MHNFEVGDVVKFAVISRDKIYTEKIGIVVQINVIRRAATCCLVSYPEDGEIFEIYNSHLTKVE